MLNLVNLPGLRVAEEIYKAHFQRQLDQVSTDAKDRLFSWQTHKGQDNITGSAERKKVRPLGGTGTLTHVLEDFILFWSGPVLPFALTYVSGEANSSIRPHSPASKKSCNGLWKNHESHEPKYFLLCHSHDRSTETESLSCALLVIYKSLQVLLVYAEAWVPLTYRSAGAEKRTVSELAYLKLCKNRKIFKI